MEDEGNGLNCRGGWAVVRLARWAGVAVMASPTALAIWTGVDYPNRSDFPEGNVRFVWQFLVNGEPDHVDRRRTVVVGPVS